MLACHNNLCMRYKLVPCFNRFVAKVCLSLCGHTGSEIQAFIHASLIIFSTEFLESCFPLVLFECEQNK